MRLMDAMLFIGGSRDLESFQSADLDAVRRMLDKYGIERALVSSMPWHGPSVEHANEVVFEAAAADERLIPCPIALPDSCLAVGDEEEYVADFVRNGARCVCFYPKGLRTGLSERVVGGLFHALERRRVPVALFETPVAEAAPVLDAYPELAVIIHAPDTRNRAWLPTFREASNLYISLMANFSPYLGLEVLAEHADVERVLLATGFPAAEPGAAIAHLLFSSLSDEDAEKVAHGNLERLIREVKGDESHADEAETASPIEVRDLPARVGGLCESVWKREPPAIEGMIDMHAHYGKWAGFDVWGGEAEDLIEEMDRLGVETILVSHSTVSGWDVRWGNDDVLDAMRRYPGRILGYAACWPFNPDAGLDEVKRCIDAGMPGVKLHPYGTTATYAEEAFAPIWSYANERALPVLLHTWGGVEKLHPLIERYPRAQVLLGHSGAKEADAYVACARKFPNVWLELACSRAPYRIVEHFVSEVGAERVLFGTDAPWMSIQQQLGRVLFADIPDDAKRHILIENAQQLLGRC